MTMIVTNYDTGGVVIGNPEYEDGLLVFPGADTYAEGTILSRDANGNWVVCDPAESDGTEIPLGVLTIETVATAAGNVSVRVLTNGKVRADKLVYDSGAEVDVATIDALRDYGIVALEVDEQGVLDNQ